MSQSPYIRMTAARLLTLVVFVGGCSSADGPTQATGPTAGAYEVRVSSSDIPVEGMVIRISGASTAPEFTVGSGVVARFASAGAEWRVVVLGPTSSQPFAVVRVADILSPPALTVEGAAGGSADGFRQIPPAQIHLTLMRR